ncbi:MAG: M56 family metallopeptidase, partial [Bacteroidales bacterium]
MKEEAKMEFIHNLISDRVLYSLGWTFIHSLWQGFLIGMSVGLVLILFRKQTARIRYLLAVGSLAAILILTAATFIRLYSGTAEQLSYGEFRQGTTDAGFSLPENLSSPVLADSELAASGLTAFFQEFKGYYNRHFPFIVTLWIAGIFIFCLKLTGGLVYSERMKYLGTSPLPGIWNNTIATLTDRMGIKKPVRVLQSSLARVPMVIGYFKPVILLPLSVLSGIPGDQIEAIIAHELAHIRRNDFVVNLFQSLMEAVFFYHPAVWWISGIIRKEREHCCDDMAVKGGSGSLVYAKALVTLQEYSMNTPRYAVAMTGKRHALLSRIRRITQKPVTRPNLSDRWLTAGMILLVVTCLTVSPGITGRNSTQAAAYPAGETGNLFPLLTTQLAYPDAGVPMILQDTVKQPKTRTINTRFFDDSDQKEKQVRMVLENGKVRELY